VELFPVLRWIRRRWAVLAVGGGVAIVMAIAIGLPPTTSSAVAWTRVTLDTRTSQLVEPAPGGAETLPWRASLLTHLLTGDVTQRQLAQRVGVRPDQVTVVDQALSVPESPASMPQIAAKVANVTRAPYVLTVAMPDQALPIISLVAAAPDRAGAVRLANAAVAVVGSRASAGGTYRSPILTDPAYPPALQPFVIDQVTPVHAKTVVARPMPGKAVAVLVFVFGAWCAAVALLPRLMPRRRTLAAG
jgi:hypothetical protein